MENIHAVHSVHAVVGGGIVLGAVGAEIVVVLIINEGDGLHHIEIVVAAIDLLAAFVQVEIVEAYLLLLLDGVF